VDAQIDGHAEVKNQYTQTGEEYDEFILLSSIYGIDNKNIFVPGESSNKQQIELHKLDLYNNKLIKLQLFNEKKTPSEIKVLNMRA